MKILYRAHQLLHQVGMELIFKIFPGCIGSLYIIIITSFYTALRSNSFEIFLATFSLWFTLCISIKILYTLAYKVTEYSEIFLNSFVKSPGFKTPKNVKFFRSCHPLDINLGLVFRIIRNTFLYAMHAVIINATISLLVAFPNTNKVLQ